MLILFGLQVGFLKAKGLLVRAKGFHAEYAVRSAMLRGVLSGLGAGLLVVREL